jgi:hypothetical protein
MAPVKYEKCAHPVCSCATTSGEFCSAECEAMKQTLDAHCPCKHTGCKDSKHSIAALIQNKMHDNVKYKVESGVVTLSGEVNSQSRRDHAEKVALNVPNVKQVVNDLQVKNQKASSSM